MFNFLLNDVTSAAGYNAALNQLSGEAATGAQQTTFDAMNMFMGTMIDPFNRRHDIDAGRRRERLCLRRRCQRLCLRWPQAHRRRARRLCDVHQGAAGRAFEQRWSVWAAGFGGSQTTDGNAAVGSNNTTSSVYGTAVGADYLFSPFTVAGFALAGGGTNFSVADSGSGHSDLFQAGAFVRTRLALLISRPHWPMAGRTSPPTAP